MDCMRWRSAWESSAIRTFFDIDGPPQNYQKIEMQVQDHARSVFLVLRLDCNRVAFQQVTRGRVSAPGPLGEFAKRCLSQLEILSHRRAFRRRPMRNAA